MKKCRRCSKPATLHITEIRDGDVQELHLCESCAQDYLSNPEASDASEEIDGLAAKLGEAAGDQDLEQLDARFFHRGHRGHRHHPCEIVRGSGVLDLDVGGDKPIFDDEDDPLGVLIHRLGRDPRTRVGTKSPAAREDHCGHE